MTRNVSWSLLAWVAASGAATQAAGCNNLLGIEDLEPAYEVEVQAIGVLGPVMLKLQRNGEEANTREITESGSFSFDIRFKPGDTYDVELMEPAMPCALEGASGTIESAEPVVALTCTGASLHSVALSGLPAAIELVPGQTEYELELPFMQDEVIMTAYAAMPDDSLSIAGEPAASGIPITLPALSLGDNEVEIQVENELGWHQTYRLMLRRTRLAQSAYGKASNTDEGDQLGYSVAVSDDTLVVGAPYEDSAATGVDDDEASDMARDSGAVYVFRRMGASWVQEAYLKASNTGASDLFGWSVSVSEDTLVVGAPKESSVAKGIDGDETNDSAGNSGAAYVFRRNGSSWRQEAYVKASNAEAGDQFGWNVSISGDTLAVSAYGEDSAAARINGNQADNMASDSGAVYVFRRGASGWVQESYIKGFNTETKDRFGYSISLSGDTLAVGAHGEDGSGTGVNSRTETSNDKTDTGAVYVFRRVGSSWGQEAYVKASNTDNSDYFGMSVSVSGDTLVVGAHGEDGAATGVDSTANNGAGNSGAAFVFRRAGNVWTQEAYLKASNTEAHDQFGYAVAVSGDTLAVGSRFEASLSTGIDGGQDNNDAAQSGAVYVFQRSEDSWTQAAYVKASNTGAEDYFGYSLGISDGTLAIGAYGEDSATAGIDGDELNSSASQSGAVYIFH